MPLTLVQNLLRFSDTPALPSTMALWLGMKVSWAVLLAYATTLFSRNQAIGVRRWLALLVGCYAILPGPFSITYWLGLAFQIPSITSVLLFGTLLSRTLTFSKDAKHLNIVSEAYWINIYAILGVLLGYVLLLDTFAQLPFELYSFGFGQMVLMLFILIYLLPMIFVKRQSESHEKLIYLSILWMILFITTRLPTGNVFDASIDPLLWVYLHVYLIKIWAKHLRRV